MNLPRGCKERLNQVLLSAYPSEFELKRLVSYGLKEELPVIVRHGPLDQMVFELIDWAESRGKIQALIEVAHYYNPRNPLLRKLHMELFGYVRPAILGSPLTQNMPIWIGPRASWGAVLIVGVCVALGMAWNFLDRSATPDVSVTSKDEVPRKRVNPPEAVSQPIPAIPAPDKNPSPSTSGKTVSQDGRLDRAGATQQPKPLMIVEARHMTGSPSSASPPVDQQAPLQLEERPSAQAPYLQANRALTATARSQSPIFVSVVGVEQLSSKLADALRIGLRQAGFMIAENSKQAVLLLEVFVLRVDGPTNDLSGSVSMWRVTSRLEARLAWAGDRSVLFVETLDTEGMSATPNTARADALRQGVNEIIQKLNVLTRN